MESKLSKAINKINDFLITEKFMAAVFVLAAVFILTRQIVIGTLVFIVFTALVLIFCSDVIATTLPFMILSCFAAKNSHAFENFKGYWWLSLLMIAALVFHFAAFVKKEDFSFGRSFWPLLAVSVAVTLGGTGIITAPEYFSGVSVYNTIGLGFGMLFSYILLNALIKPSDKYVFSERFTNIMVITAVFACFMIVHHYIINIASFIDKPQILQFQWRNNISTMLMITMPFVFKKATKRTSYIFFAFFIILCLLLAGSRGGMLFGLIEFVICCITVLAVDRKHTKRYLAIYLTALACVVIATPALLVFVRVTLERFISFDQNEIRIGLFSRAIEDFRANPMFGRGLGYMGNRDIHKSAEFALCWYHSSPFQVIGSFGVMGIFAYIFIFVNRVYIFIKTRKNFFSITLFLSYIGLELMSLVNPGIFIPVPYLFIVTMMFVIMDKIKLQSDIDEYREMKKIKN
ncbi:MAG: O-antigen ligase family protein [Oscillospiraceae bacterium]|jgi:hypothetical protein|nr:O-antigen ligase family protein [Oscillospiraceae bacterium]